MQVWITKYALTDGIRVVNAEVSIASSDVFIYGRRGGLVNHFASGEGKDWHRTLESAELRAETMRKAKIASLKKSLAKMEAMTFKAPR